MHAFWHIGAEANMVALREPFPIHLDTRTDVVTMHRDANRDLGLDMEPRGGMPLPLMLLELVVLMQGDDTGREHGMYPRPATPLTLSRR